MGPQVDPVVTDTVLPVRADVVVIGGGIIGVSAALYLARQGVSVVLCEKGLLAGEQSSRNWGWVRKTGRDLREVPLIIEGAADVARVCAGGAGDGVGRVRRAVCGDQRWCGRAARALGWSGWRRIRWAAGWWRATNWRR